MKYSVSALIPAAGSGERLGMGPKAVVELNGKSLLERAISAFSGIANEIIVALPESHLGMDLPDAVQRVLGGVSRQQSVQNLLNAATSEIVLIHDAARPFLPPEIVRATLEAVLEIGAATVALPAADTLVLEDAVPGERKTWGMLLDRTKVHAIQTPQGFRRELILNAHRRAKLERVTATDDAGLVARLGLPVALVTGDPRLFKVTRPGDYALAEAFARVWDGEER